MSVAKGTALALLPLLVASTVPSYAQESATKAETTPLAGYSATASATEREWETKFRALPSPDNQREYMRHLTAHPHHVGSPYDKENAEWILSQFKELGAGRRDRDLLRALSHAQRPRTGAARANAPSRRSCRSLRSREDPTSNQQAEQLPTYNAYSIDGDVTAPLVYVNQGVREDYERLDRMGVSVKGAIVIARYGGAWRGIKPKVAAEHGAVGCIIYSDPQRRRLRARRCLPERRISPRGRRAARRRQRHLLQRRPAHSRLCRDQRRQAAADQRQPRDHQDSGHADLLRRRRAAARGHRRPDRPREWRGNLPITYHVGPGPAKVHLKVTSNWDIKPIYDVIGRIPGSEFPDQWVIRGNHHDAWVNGAEDPISGQVALMEEARSMGELVKQGWKPKRTIIFCAWDGEEPGLLGSTEWVEMHQDELRKKAVMYVNSDTNGRGFLGIDGSHTLEHFINSVERDIPDPETKLTVWKRAQLYQIAHPEGENGSRRRRATGKICALALWATAPTMCRCPLHRHRLARPRIWRRGRRRRLSLDLRRFLLVHPLRRHRLRLRPRACRRRQARR